MLKHYIIRVVKGPENSWYSDMIGEVFHVFKIESSFIYYFSAFMYFYPEDVEEVVGKLDREPLLPTHNIYNYA